MQSFYDGQEADECARLSWEAGDALTISAYSPPKLRRGLLRTGPQGLSYETQTVIAVEPGFAGGWDVWEGSRATGEMSFYGFSVVAVHKRV